MLDATIADRPQQRTLADRPSPLPYERGTTEDGRVHAVRKTLNGPRASCDVSVALHRLGGRFDYDDLDSCLPCIIETAQRSITLP
jgi:hypothetical protein